MSHLKSLTLTAVPAVVTDPAQRRRLRLIARLEEQRQLLLTPSLTRTIRRVVEAEDGSKSVVERAVPVRSWWRLDDRGRMVFFMRSGMRLIELDKGKTGVVAESRDSLPSVIDTLIAAVRAGELDAQLGLAVQKQEAAAARRPK
jgi:hypothetical protein